MQNKLGIALEIDMQYSVVFLFQGRKPLEPMFQLVLYSRRCQTSEILQNSSGQNSEATEDICKFISQLGNINVHVLFENE